MKTKEKIQQFSKLQILSLVLFSVGLLFLSQSIIEHDTYKEKNMGVKEMKCSAGKCGDT